LLQGHKSRYVLAAARHLALDSDSRERGSPLTQNFCDALEGKVPAAVSPAGWVSVTAAGQYARERVQQEAALLKHRQEAIAFEIGGTICLTRVAGADSVAARLAKAWQPRVCYPLQPAPHFQGRQRLRAELAGWARALGTPDRVVSLVAVGGTGKTALAERVLADLGDRLRAGLLVWSFYEASQTEGFLRAACEYFTGETPASPGGLLERLQVALVGDEPHLLVLDGLERVQTEGTTGRPRGGLEDPQLRRLLRWLATGQGTRTRALVTSRFPLVDLDNWKGAGYREERLEDLEPEAARAVLRGWGVKGGDATLDGLAEPLHCHALSVAVLGSYLGKLWGGDPSKAPTFDREEMAPADPKAARLTRILTHYAEKLPSIERDLLARLSTFPCGVTVEFLNFLIDAGGEIAGALFGCNQVRLLWVLEQLRELGLVFRYDTTQGAAFTAHPFLRDYFRRLLVVTKPEEIHEAVRARLAPNLETVPDNKPTDPALLDRYEALIEHTRLAGRIQEAFDLYWFGLGAFRHVGGVLGDHARGLRILSAFSLDGTPQTAALDLPVKDRGSLVYDWGLFAESRGDLTTTRLTLAVAGELARSTGDAQHLSVNVRKRAEVELLASRLLLAEEYATDALREAGRAGSPRRTKNCHICLAIAFFHLGKLGDAQRHFAEATKLDSRPYLCNLGGIWEAEYKLAVGDRSGAAAQTQANRAICLERRWTGIQAQCDTLLGLLALPDDLLTAWQCLCASRSYAGRSDHVEVQLRCYHLAAELARAERACNLAQSEAEAGINLADTCGFGHYSIELRLALARACLDASDFKAALRRAGEALERSVHPECQYAWGEADGLHLCGVAHARLAEIDLARQRLTAALAKRGQLSHPGLAATRTELDRLGG
jgi:hypothetical protein